jgi:hypothetical protein
LRVSLEFPTAWDVSNGEIQVTARERDSSNAAKGLDVSVRWSEKSLRALEADAGTYEGIINRAQMTVRAAQLQALALTLSAAGPGEAVGRRLPDDPGNLRPHDPSNLRPTVGE